MLCGGRRPVALALDHDRPLWLGDSTVKTTLTLGSIALCTSAILLGQLSAMAGGKGDGGVAGGSTDCASAPALTVGDNAFDTSASTVSLAVPDVSGCGPHTMFRVNYFTFTPTETDTHTFSTCNAASWDTRLLLMTTCSTGSALLACNDDSCGFQSTMSAPLTAGTTYRVVIGGFGATDAGAGPPARSQQEEGGAEELVAERERWRESHAPSAREHRFDCVFPPATRTEEEPVSCRPRLSCGSRVSVNSSSICSRGGSSNNKKAKLIYIFFAPARRRSCASAPCPATRR